MKRIVFTLITALVALAVEAQSTISQQPTDQFVTNGGTAIFTVSVSGIGPFTYQWQFNGTNLPINIIRTVAGNGAQGFSGDGGIATSASLNLPNDLVVDSAENLFIFDFGNHRVRKLAPNGIITTVAGNGTFGISYDGGEATNSMLEASAIAVDVAGNLFIADANRIRKVDTNGIITTVVGGGMLQAQNGIVATNVHFSYTLQGVAVDSCGNLFIADTLDQLVLKVDTNNILTKFAGNGIGGYSGDGGAATNASLYEPVGLAVDSIGNVFIIDASSRVRKVSSNGIITTVAGNGTNGFSGDGGPATNAAMLPAAIAIDGGGNLFIASNNRIREVATNGIITTVVGNGTNGYIGDGGSANKAELNYPEGIAIGSAANMFIADNGNQRIRMVGSLPTLVLNNISPTNVGNYSVIVFSPSGSITSNVAKLVIPPVNIIQQPQNQSVSNISDVTFSVLANGLSALSYQWYFINTNLQANAAAIAQMFNGFIYGAVVTNGGSGYTTIPQVQFVGGGGAGASGEAVVSNGMVTAINVTSTGLGYTNLPSIQIDPPNGLLIGQTNAALNLNAINTNNIGAYFVVISNSYGSVTSSIAYLTIGNPNIVQQPQNVNTALGGTASFNVIANGASELNYQWWKSSIQQSNATAIPTVVNGFVLGALVTSGGAGYLSAPQVQFVGGSGSSASGTAVISNGMVTAINMTSPGSNYITSPTIQIDPPSAVSLFGETNDTLYFSTVTYDNMGNYFVVVTNNFGSVTSALAALTVFLPPQSLTASSASNHQVALQLIGTPNYPYILQSTTNLTPPVNWQPVLTNPANGNGNWQFTDTNLNGSQKFYRAAGQ